MTQLNDKSDSVPFLVRYNKAKNALHSMNIKKNGAVVYGKKNFEYFELKDIICAIDQVINNAGHFSPQTMWYVFMPLSLKVYMDNDPAFFYSNSGIAHTPQTMQAQQANYKYIVKYINDRSFISNESLWEDGNKVVRCIIVPDTAVVQGVWTPFEGGMYNMEILNDYGSALGYNGFYMVSKLVTSFTLVRPDLAIWVGARIKS